MLRCVPALALAMGIAAAVGPAPALAFQGGKKLPPRADAMHVGGEVTGPFAFQDFCRRTPNACQADADLGGRPNLDLSRWRDLLEVNDIVNRTVNAKSDLDLFGVLDYWTMAGRYGDCEDYVLTKQAMLRERGWPMSSTLVTVVRDENGEGHAVLTARTKHGDFILDNRQNRIVAWNETPYQFVKRQSTLNPKVWLALAPDLLPPKEILASNSTRKQR